MAKTSSHKPKLTQNERDEIIRLATEEKMSYTDIAKKMGCSIPNISYLMKKHKEREATKQKKEDARNKANPTRGEYPTDPISFRIGKLLEIESDIQFARDEKVIHTLGSLHKLHLTLHDELRTFIEASKDIHGATPEQLKIEIVDAIHALPPLLKKQVMDELLVDGSNVVRLKTQ
jgi:transposase-like protein